ncbi:MAG: DUF1559 domain-containing protein [Planctomycetes bacterium]|nr:DUF1559 domain-containing protein [Planctomycetota bacterium]
MIELLVVVSIIALLIAILLPSLTRARQVAQQTVCLANMRQVGVGYALYANANKTQLPWGYWYNNVANTHIEFDDLLFPYLGQQLTYQQQIGTDLRSVISGKSVFECPADKRGMGRTYSMARTADFSVGQSYGVATSSYLSANPPSPRYITELRRPADLMILLERPSQYNRLGDDNTSVTDSPDQITIYVPWLHDPQLNFLFVDGHAAGMSPTDNIGNGTTAFPRGMWTRDPND